MCTNGGDRIVALWSVCPVARANTEERHHRASGQQDRQERNEPGGSNCHGHTSIRHRLMTERSTQTSAIPGSAGPRRTTAPPRSARRAHRYGRALRRPSPAALGGDDHLIVRRRATVDRNVAERGRDRGDVVGHAGVFVDIERDDAAGGKRLFKRPRNASVLRRVGTPVVSVSLDGRRNASMRIRS